MEMSAKQREYWNAPYHRWNLKYGATRSGKTWLDYYMIPRRILEMRGLPGRIVLIGNTRGTLRRNVLDPMREMYGEGLVGPLRGDGTVTLFGETAHTLGADTKTAVDRLRGASVKYCYGDEVVSWNEEVFEMLKSRLDRPYSRFDGTCNPEGPDHFVNRFLQSGADIFSQRYELDDNPFLPEAVRGALKREHTGVFYDRYILGKWAVAEGLVFPELARRSEAWCTDDVSGVYEKICIGVDFGGYGSRTCMAAVGFRGNFRELTLLEEAALPVRESVDAEDIAREYVRFASEVKERYGRLDHTFGDSASPTMINTLVSASGSAGLGRSRIGPCVKTPVSQRPLTIARLLGAKRLRFRSACTQTVDALCRLRWSAGDATVPEDRNLGNINDAYDAFCYAWTAYAGKIERR